MWRSRAVAVARSGGYGQKRRFKAGRCVWVVTRFGVPPGRCMRHDRSICPMAGRHARCAGADPEVSPVVQNEGMLMTDIATGAGTDDRITGEILKIAGVVVLGAIMSILDITVVNVALPTFQTTFGSVGHPLAY